MITFHRFLFPFSSSNHALVEFTLGFTMKTYEYLLKCKLGAANQ